MLRKRLSRQLFLTTALLVAQVKGQTPLYFDHHGIAEGLIGSSVNTIVSGPQGSIWAGTQEGLNEFDGFEFHATTKEKHLSLRAPTS